MNVFTILVLLILAAFALNGWRRGFVRAFTHMFFFLASAALVYLATPYISGFLKEYTPVYEMVEENCREALTESAGGQEESRLEQKKFIEGMGLPKILEQQLINGNNKDSYQEMDISGFSDYLSGYMAGLILNIATFVITLALVHLILRMTVLTLDNLSKLPVLHSINQTLGMVLGIGQGLLVVWLAFLVITVLGNTEAGQRMMGMIHESPVLEALYNMNIFLEYFLEMVAGK